MQHAPARELLHFIKNSPTCYHVTENIRQKLLANGYTELSERERSVAQLMALRKTNREIAETLFLSEGTVKQYINRIYSKLQLTGTAQEKRRALTALLQKN